jgi:hypothetical protein
VEERFFLQSTLVLVELERQQVLAYADEVKRVARKLLALEQAVASVKEVVPQVPEGSDQHPDLQSPGSTVRVALRPSLAQTPAPWAAVAVSAPTPP